MFSSKSTVLLQKCPMLPTKVLLNIVYLKKKICVKQTPTNFNSSAVKSE